MKRLLLLLAFMPAISQTSFGQWTGTVPGPIYYNSGNVNVGTPSDLGSKLNVVGDINVTPMSNPSGPSTARQIIIGEASNNTAYKLALGYYQDSGTGVYTGVIQSTHGGAGNNLEINPNGGHVGIGTTSPAYKLHITGNSDLAPNSPAIELENTSSNSANRNWLIANGMNNYGDLEFSVGATQGGVVNNGGTKMTILPSGNVGIGTTSPASQLEVAGDPTLYAGSAYQSTIQSRDTRVVAAGVGGGIIFSGNYTALPNNTAFAGVAGVKENGTSGDYAGALLFSTRGNGSAPTERMRISSAGYIGIGTTTPDATLSVKGTIHAQEVKVDMTGWSDYVFKPTYKLSKLSDVKNYIDENHHLPEMPSEKEVVENGIKLTEMLKLQQKKIEELTLYLIEKDQQLNDQGAAIRQQQAQFQKLNKSLQKQIDHLKSKSTQK